MNELIIPPSALWYRGSIVICSPDNTLVYGGKNDIIIIREKGSEEPPEIKILQGAHSKNITSLSMNKKWKEPHSYVVSSGEESVIKVWDLDNYKKKFINTGHTEHKEAVVGAVFAGDDRVVSAATDGFIIVWNLNSNESKVINNLFNAKVTITCLSSCPHAGWLLAFGCNNGCVIVADMRRNGNVLYKLRGHYQAVTSLSWCPAPINVFPRNTQNKVRNKIDETKESLNVVQKQEKTEVKKVDKSNPWINLIHADDGEVPSESDDPLAETVNDFLQECDHLKSKIMGLDIPVANGETSMKLDEEEEEEEVTPKYEEKGIEETLEREIIQKIDNDRPLPKLYDPSGDFLDDSVIDATPEAEIFEDKDTGDEKNQKTDEDSGIVLDEAASVKIEIVEEEPRMEYLLASSGKDRSVYIWRAGTDGRMQTFFHTPKRFKNRDSKNANVWIALCWIAPDKILTSSTTGEVLEWPLPKPKESNRQFRVVHFEHFSTIFNIVAPPKYLSAYNWRDSIDSTVWTWSQDGRLINYDLKSQKIRFCYSTVTAPVTCFDASILDPNRLAIGVRDGTIRVWDLSLPHSNIVSMQKFFHKYTHKVTAIAWSPKKEMILGFGTEEGRVGFIDLSSKKYTLFSHYFHTQVYKVEWGPILGEISNLGLYAVAEGKVAIYDMTHANDDPLLLDLAQQLYVHKFAWKPDYSLLLLNGKDGSLVILTTSLVALTTIYLNDKGLNGITWHPDASTNETAISSRCNWFAATTSKGVLIYDCVLPKESNAEESENYMENVVAVFEGHLRPPLSVVWCPFDGDKLVSTAADGLLHVWDITSKSAISTFVDPYFYHNPAVIWSPIDPDLIIIGDKVIRVWSISKNPPKIDEEFLSARKKLLSKTTTKTDSDKTDKNKIKVEIPRLKNTSKTCLVPSLYVSNDENLALQVANMKMIMNQRENNTPNDKDSGSKLDPLQLFGEKDQVSQLLTANLNQQKNDAKLKSCELISLWKGNIREYIEEAITENRVTPSVITLAPMVSLKLWQDACDVYAKKLSESADSDPLETTMYFLACHKVEEAINCLCLALMFKEALALAKHRLPSNSDIITTVTHKWAEYSINTGNFETAAYCYISIGQYENAAKVLSRRNNREFLEFASELAEKENNKTLYDSIKFKLNELEKGEVQETEPSLPSRVNAIFEMAETSEKPGSCSETQNKTNTGEEVATAKEAKAVTTAEEAEAITTADEAEAITTAEEAEAVTTAEEAEAVKKAEGAEAVTTTEKAEDISLPKD